MAAPLMLIVFLAVPASAQRIPDCVHISSTSARFMKTLDDVRDCQEKAREKAVSDAEAKGKPLTYEQLEKFDDRQREQVRDYLANSGTVIDGATKSRRGLGGVTAKDRSRVSAEEGAELEALEKRLHDRAGDGKDGITPEMGKDILETLTKKQGGVSPEMRDLIESVVRDGGKLKPETMKKLQNAGKNAKGVGLDLNIDPGVEKGLLEHDFDKDKERADPGVL